MRLSGICVYKHEATAFADPENEQLIQAALAKLMQGKTVIVIAHRLGTVKNSNQIIVMEKGRVAEAGTHNNLVEKNGVYAHMWQRYTQSLSWDIGDSRKEVMNCENA